MLAFVVLVDCLLTVVWVVVFDGGLDDVVSDIHNLPELSLRYDQNIGFLHTPNPPKTNLNILPNLLNKNLLILPNKNNFPSFPFPPIPFLCIPSQHRTPQFQLPTINNNNIVNWVTLFHYLLLFCYAVFLA